MPLLLLVVSIGCGGSPTPETPPVVTPPPTEDVSPGVSSGPAALPPGGMELPPDALPSSAPANPVPPGESKGGFEMPQDARTSNPSEASPGGSSEPLPVRYASWKEIRDQATSTGRVTVVDLWSLSCEPCLKEFPQLVRMHQTLGDSVRCVAVNLDFDGRKTRPPQYYEDQVATFLASVGAEDLPAFICNTPSDDVFSRADIISIPAVLIFDAQGEPVKVFADAGDTLGFTYEKDIFPLIEKLAS